MVKKKGKNTTNKKSVRGYKKAKRGLSKLKRLRP